MVVEVVVVGGGVGRNLLDDPMLRRGELLVLEPNLGREFSRPERLEGCYLEGKGLDLKAVSVVVGAVVWSVCLKEFLKFGLLVTTSSLAGLWLVVGGGVLIFTGVSRAGRLGSSSSSWTGLAGLALPTLGLSRISCRAAGAGRDSFSFSWVSTLILGTVFLLLGLACTCNSILTLGVPRTVSYLRLRVEPVTGELPHVELLVPVVLATLRDLVGVRALSVHAVAGASVEDSPQRTAVLPGDPAYAEVVLPAVGRVGVLGEDAGAALGTGELAALLVHHQRAAALLHLVRPPAAPALLVVGEARGTHVPVGLPVLAHPEHRAVLLVLEGAPCSGTVRGGDGRLQLRPLPALHQVQLSALLQGEGGVRVDEAQAVAAGSEVRESLGAVPVLVAAVEVGVEALEVVRTTEVVHQLGLGPGNKTGHQQYQAEVGIVTGSEWRQVVKGQSYSYGQSELSQN